MSQLGSGSIAVIQSLFRTAVRQASPASAATGLFKNNRLPREGRKTVALRGPGFSGPAGAVALVGRDRGRSQSLAAARLTFSAPSGSESAPVAMRNFGSFG